MKTIAIEKIRGSRGTVVILTVDHATGRATIERPAGGADHMGAGDPRVTQFLARADDIRTER